MICIIGCGKAKEKKPKPAYQLYSGNYYKTTLEVARSVFPIEAIFILSAKHGLIRATEIIAPYDVELTQYDALFVEKVRKQAAQLQILDYKVTAICGQHYMAVVNEVFNEVVRPFQGKGMGDLISKMQSFLEKRRGVCHA